MVCSLTASQYSPGASTTWTVERWAAWSVPVLYSQSTNATLMKLALRYSTASLPAKGVVWPYLSWKPALVPPSVAPFSVCGGTGVAVGLGDEVGEGSTARSRLERKAAKSARTARRSVQEKRSIRRTRRRSNGDPASGLERDPLVWLSSPGSLVTSTSSLSMGICPGFVSPRAGRRSALPVRSPAPNCRRHRTARVVKRRAARAAQLGTGTEGHWRDLTAGEGVLDDACYTEAQ